jgi:hypothetical protein
MKMQMLRAFVLLLAAGLSARAVEKLPASVATRQAAEASPQARAFLAFPDADRKAAQDALGWLGFYNGVVDGAFGKRTVDALRAYQSSIGAQPDGNMTARGLAALKEAAAKAKAEVGFRLIDDPATGVRIGAPMKILEKRKSGAGAAALVSKDGKVGLYLKETTGGLAALYKSLSADVGPRKVTYKYLKPDVFFVTAGEEGDDKFYRRYAANGDTLRGFAFVYPKARAKALDPVALAVANSFEPFPAAPKPTPKPTPTPAPAPAGPKLAATALVVAPGVAITALDPAQCKAPTIAGQPATFLAPQGGLARLGGAFGAGATAPPIGPGGGDLVALSLVPGAAGPALEAGPAETLASGAVVAALAPSGSGAPLFDRQGRLVAFVGPIKAAPARAGVAMRAPHATISAAALGSPAGDGPSLTAAEIARLRRAAIVGVFCAS